MSCPENPEAKGEKDSQKSRRRRLRRRREGRRRRGFWSIIAISGHVYLFPGNGVENPVDVSGHPLGVAANVDVAALGGDDLPDLRGLSGHRRRAAAVRHP